MGPRVARGVRPGAVVVDHGSEANVKRALYITAKKDGAVITYHDCNGYDTEDKLNKGDSVAFVVTCDDDGFTIKMKEA
jgi:hypothetical protein